MLTWSDLLKSMLMSHEQLFLGWLLGLLGPAIIDNIRRKRRIRALKESLALELHELQYTMTVKALVFRMRSGKADTVFFRWCDEVMNRYKGQEIDARLHESVKGILQLGPKNIPATDLKRGLALSDATASLLNVHTNEIAQFPIPVQAWLLKIVRELGYFNHQVVDNRRMFDRTYENQSPHNMQLIRTNLEEGYAGLDDRAVTIAKLIGKAPNGFMKSY